MFHNYCFAKEVNIITDHKPSVAIVSKYVATLSQCSQCIMLCIHPYNMHILYKLGPNLCIVDWLSYHNHTENKDQEIAGMNINIHTLSIAIDVPVCTSIEDIRNAMSIDTELQMLQTYIEVGCRTKATWSVLYTDTGH